MPRGSYTLKCQIGGRGAFAQVTLETQVTLPPVQIDIADTGPIARHFIPAAKTGVHFAWSQLFFEGHNPPLVNVTIYEIVEWPADTSDMMVVYAAANAMCDALGMTLIRQIEFDCVERRIIFPL